MGHHTSYVRKTHKSASLPEMTDKDLYNMFMRRMGITVATKLANKHGNRGVNVDMTTAMRLSPTFRKLDAAMRRGEDRSAWYNVRRTAKETDPAAYARWLANNDRARAQTTEEEIEETWRRCAALDARLAASAFWEDFETYQAIRSENWQEYAAWSRDLDFGALMDEYEANELAVWSE